MGNTELPWLYRGRHIRPYAFAVSLASATLFGLIASGETVWGDGNAWDGAVLTLAAASVLLLWLGFWKPSTALMQHGLMLSAVVFAVRGTYIGLVGGSWLTAMLSYCWTVASGGAWLLERTTGERIGGGSE